MRRWILSVWINVRNKREDMTAEDTFWVILQFFIFTTLHHINTRTVWHPSIQQISADWQNYLQLYEFHFIDDMISQNISFKIKICYSTNVLESSISVLRQGDLLLSYSISSPCPDDLQIQGTQPTTITKWRRKRSKGRRDEKKEKE